MYKINLHNCTKLEKNHRAFCNRLDQIVVPQSCGENSNCYESFYYIVIFRVVPAACNRRNFLIFQNSCIFHFKHIYSLFFQSCFIFSTTSSIEYVFPLISFNIISARQLFLSLQINLILLKRFNGFLQDGQYGLPFLSQYTGYIYFSLGKVL